MSEAQRWLLPTGALATLARTCAVPLPALWVQSPTVLDSALLAQIHDLPDAADLAPWRTPAVTVRLLVAPLATQRSVPSTGPAAALDAHLTIGEDRLVGLLRRDGVGLVELTTAPAEGIAPELDRVLAVVGGVAGDGEELRVSRHHWTEQCESGSGPVAAVLGRATRVLEATVVAAEGSLAGGLWYDAGGWWRVEAYGADVVVRPSLPRCRDLAPLLDQVLTC